MNFSTSDVWNNSIILRYPIDKIRKIGNLYFVENENILKCQHFFDFDIGTNVLDSLKVQVLNHKKIKFNYINDSELLKKLENWANANQFTYEIIDKWEAPLLFLDTDIKDYLKNNFHSQIRKNYKNYIRNKNNYKFYNSSIDDVIHLWNYVLDIDFHSWKKEENSDMKSLDREDLQYFPFLLTNNKNSNLVVVCDLNDNPLAYSLMFKNDNGCWYAVKWGASTIGRKNYIGFFSLFNHLEYLYEKENHIFLDFWGRRSFVYDSLKNESIVRNHIVIYKKEE